MPLGAESDYYFALASPYEAANGSFETVDELRLVKGVDEALFEGDGTEMSPGLRNLVTVRSGERNVDHARRPRLNINRATPAEVAARLGDILTSEELEAVERRRRQGPLASLADALAIEGAPWRKMAQALDRIRVDDRDSVEGTVNLNTARETVLEAIGLSAEVAQTLVESRAGEPLETKGELANIAGMTGDMMRAVADSVATKSSVFRVAASAQAEARPLHAGVFALVDRSGQAPRLIMWREQSTSPAGATAGEE